MNSVPQQPDNDTVEWAALALDMSRREAQWVLAVLIEHGWSPHGRYDEAVAQMVDPERYKVLRAISFEDRHPCPVDECRLSAEEHHRLMFGIMSENRALKQSNPLADPMNPAYQRGFVAGADAVIELAIECIGDQTTANLREVARERGYIA